MRLRESRLEEIKIDALKNKAAEIFVTQSHFGNYSRSKDRWKFH